MNKRLFLQVFDDFLGDFEQEGYGKCYFKLMGMDCQGWIIEINETTFTYGDSGPMAREEPYEFQIDEIDTDTFAYWDAEVNQWTNYYIPDALENRKRMSRK